MQLFSSPDSPKPETFAALVDRLGGAEAIEALARRHSAFHRARHIKSAADLLRLILAYAPGGRSLRKLAAEAAASGVVDVSDVALLTRFRRCGDWLIALCENLFARRDERAGAQKWGPRHRRLAYRGTRQNLLSAASVLRCRRPADRRFRHYPAR